MKMDYCCIRACRSYGIPHDKSDLFPLPSSDEEKLLWISAFGINPTEINDSFRVCGAHFRRKYFLGDKPEMEANKHTYQIPGTMKLPKPSAGQKTFLILTPQGEAFPVLAPNAEALKLAVPQIQVLPQSSVNFNYTAPSIRTETYVRDVIVRNVSKQSTLPPSASQQQNVCSIVQVQSLFPTSIDTTMTKSQSNSSEGCSSSLDISSDVASSSTSSEVVDNIALNLECEEDNLTSAQKNAQSTQFSSSEASALLQNLSKQYASDAVLSKENSNSVALMSRPMNVLKPNVPSNLLTTVQLSIKELTPTTHKSIPLKISVVPMKLEESQKYVEDKEFAPKKVAEEILPIALGTRKKSTEESPSVSNKFSRIFLSKEIPACSEGLKDKNVASDKSMDIDAQAKTDMISPKILPSKEASSNSQNLEEDITIVSDKSANENKEQAKQGNIDTLNSGTSSQKEVIETSESEKDLETKSDLDGETSDENSPALIELVLSDEEDVKEVAQNETKCDAEKEADFEKVKENLRQQVYEMRNILEGNAKPPGLQQEMKSASSDQVDRDLDLKSPNVMLSLTKVKNPFSAVAGNDTLDKGKGQTSSKSENQMDRKEPDFNNIPSCALRKDLQKVVTEFTIRFLQPTIPIIPSGIKQVSMQTLLEVKTYGLLPYSEEEARSLRFRLREENSVLGCVQWLAERKYIPKEVSCSNCGASCSLRREKSVPDGWCYLCDKCNLKFEVKRNKIWQSFSNYSLEELILLTYHWACQSNISEILKDVNLSLEKIFTYYTALQNFCLGIISRKIKSKTLNKKFEVAFARFHAQCIVGAYDRSNDVYYLEVIGADQIESDKYIDVLEKWQVNKSILISQRKICYWLTKFYTLCSPTRSDSPMHLMEFLLRNLGKLFGHLQHRNLHYRVIQGFLNDLQWRQRYGKYLELAFWNIIHQLFLSSNFAVGVYESINSITEKRDQREIYSAEFLERWGPFKVSFDLEEMRIFNYFSIQESDPSSNYKETSENNEISVVAVVESNSAKPQNPQVLYATGRGKEDVFDRSTAAVLNSINRMLNYNAELNPDQIELNLQKQKMNAVPVSPYVSSAVPSSTPVAPSPPLMLPVSSVSTNVGTFKPGFTFLSFKPASSSGPSCTSILPTPSNSKAPTKTSILSHLSAVRPLSAPGSIPFKPSIVRAPSALVQSSPVPPPSIRPAIVRAPSVLVQASPVPPPSIRPTIVRAPSVPVQSSPVPPPSIRPSIVRAPSVLVQSSPVPPPSILPSPVSTSSILPSPVSTPSILPSPVPTPSILPTPVLDPPTSAPPSSSVTGGPKCTLLPSGASVKKNPESRAIQVLKESNNVEILGCDIAQMPMNLLDFLNIELDDNATSQDSTKKTKPSIIEKSKPAILVDVVSADDESDVKKKTSTCSTYSTTTPKVTPPVTEISRPSSESGQSNTPSIFQLQHLIPIIPSGARGVTPLGLLSIKTHIYPARQQEASFLRVKLREENFVAGYLQWLVRHHHLPPVPTCAFCSSKNFSVYRDTKCFEGYIYRCENKTCFNQEPVKRPRFFDKFMFLSLRELLLLTYHWACQSDIEEILRDVPIDLNQIIVYFRALQELCRKILDKKGCLGGIRSPSRIEAAVVKLGKVIVLGAYDRSNNHTRLQALSHDEALNSDKHLKLLRSWIHAENILISERRLEDLNYIYSVEVNRKISSINHPGYHILNVTKYLGSRLVRMFGTFKHDELTKDVIQGYLDELQWREMYGMFLEMAFWNIFNHMKFENPSPESVTIDTRNLPLEIAFESKILRDRWGPLKASDKGVLIKPNTNKAQQKPEPTTKEPTEASKLPEKRDKRLDLAVPKVPSILSKKSSSVTTASNSGKPTSATTTLSSEAASTSTPAVDLTSVSTETAYTLMGVKIFFEENSSSTARYEHECTILGSKLKQDGFLFEPVKWMVKKGLIKSESPCYVCRGPSRLKSNSKFADGCSQICIDEKCRFENKFRRPYFLASFGFSLSNILAIIYHWAVQTDPRVIMSVIHLDIFKVLCVRRRIQDICAAIVRQCSSRLGGSGEIVEVSFAEYKTFFILGAYERKTKCSYLGAFPNFSTLELKKLQRLLQSWINKSSTVVVPSKELYEALTKSFSNVALANRTIMTRSHPGYHVLNIINYFHKSISFAFHEIEDKILTADVVQKYLYEFMWRERYGRTPEAAFWRIMKEICSYTVKDWPSSYKSKQKPQSEREGTQNVDPHTLDPQLFEKCIQNNMNLKPPQGGHSDSSSNSEDNKEFFENDSGSELQAYEKFLVSRHAALNINEKNSSEQKELEIIETDDRFASCSTPILTHVSKKFKAATDMQTTFILSEDVQELPYLPEARVVLRRIPDDILQLYSSGIVTSASALEVLLDKESCAKESPETPWETYKASYLLKNLSQMAEKNQAPVPAANTVGSIKIQSVISQGVVHIDALKPDKSPTKDALSNWWKDGLSNATVVKNSPPEKAEKELEQIKDSEDIKPISTASQKATLLSESNVDDVKPDISVTESNIKVETNKQSPLQDDDDNDDSSTSEDSDSSVDILNSDSESEKASSTKKHVEEICLDSDPEDSKPDASLLASSVESQSKMEVSAPTSNTESSEFQQKDCKLDISNAAPTLQLSIKKECSVPTDIALSSSNIIQKDCKPKIAVPVIEIPRIKELSKQTDSVVNSILEQCKKPSTSKRKPLLQIRMLKEIFEKPAPESSSKSKRKNKSVARTWVVEPVEPAIKEELGKEPSLLKDADESSPKLQRPSRGSRKPPAKRKFPFLENLGEIPTRTYSRKYKKKDTTSQLTGDSTTEENVAAGSSTNVELLESGNLKFKCIECDELVDSSHFAKQFDCPDCKKTVFTTNCPKSFFEHRSRMLFGKRMPLVRKQTLWHKEPVVVQDAWYCYCGFNTKMGNAIASHIVNCNTITCYRPTWMT